MSYREMVDELATVLNRHSAENGSNTPDFILAEYLERALANFDATVTARGTWYGRLDAPGQASPLETPLLFNTTGTLHATPLPAAEVTLDKALFAFDLPHEPDRGRTGNPANWCVRCRLDAAKHHTRHHAEFTTPEAP